LVRGGGEAFGSLLLGHCRDLIDLLGGEPGHLAELAGEPDRGLAGLAPRAPEVEQAVDGALELECLLLAVLVVLGDLAEPGAAHLHVGDLVGEHPVLAEPQHRIVHLGGEVAHRGEHVDGEPLEGSVHPGETEHRIGVARRLEQGDGLGVLADLGAHVITEHQADLDVAGLVPALAGHVELHRERRLVGRVVVRGAPGALECLDLADEDAVHLAAGAVEGLVALRVHPTGLRQPVRTHVVEAVGGADPMEPFVAGEILRRQLGAHP
jgi:hypothetical protein